MRKDLVSAQERLNFAKGISLTTILFMTVIITSIAAYIYGVTL